MLAETGDWDGLAQEASCNEALFAEIAVNLTATSKQTLQALAPEIAEVIESNRELVALVGPRLRDIGQLLDQMDGR